MAASPEGQTASLQSAISVAHGVLGNQPSYRSATNRRDTIRSQLETLRAERDAAREDLLRTQIECNELLANKESEAVKELRRDLESSNSKLSSTKDLLEQSLTRIGILEKENEIYASNFGSSMDADGLRSKMNALAADMLVKDRSIAQKQTLVAEAENQVSDLHAKLSESEAKAVALLTENIKLGAAVKATEESLAHSRDDCQRVEDMAKSHEASSVELKEVLAERTTEKDSLANRILEVQKACDTLSEEKTKLEVQKEKAQKDAADSLRALQSRFADVLAARSDANRQRTCLANWCRNARSMAHEAARQSLQESITKAANREEDLIQRVGDLEQQVETLQDRENLVSDELRNAGIDEGSLAKSTGKVLWRVTALQSQLREAAAHQEEAMIEILHSHETTARSNLAVEEWEARSAAWIDFLRTGMALERLQEASRSAEVSTAPPSADLPKNTGADASSDVMEVRDRSIPEPVVDDDEDDSSLSVVEVTEIRCTEEPESFVGDAPTELVVEVPPQVVQHVVVSPPVVHDVATQADIPDPIGAATEANDAVERAAIPAERSAIPVVTSAAIHEERAAIPVGTSVSVAEVSCASQAAESFIAVSVLRDSLNVLNDAHQEEVQRSQAEAAAREENLKNAAAEVERKINERHLVTMRFDAWRSVIVRERERRIAAKAEVAMKALLQKQLNTESIAKRAIADLKEAKKKQAPPPPPKASIVTQTDILDDNSSPKRSSSDVLLSARSQVSSLTDELRGCRKRESELTAHVARLTHLSEEATAEVSQLKLQIRSTVSQAPSQGRSEVAAALVGLLPHVRDDHRILADRICNDVLTDVEKLHHGFSVSV